ncbi:TlpA family protein disulfide reductase [Granulicella tundricola]|uniref:Alkyl hydroperoxide reductase/ Thiol specific antioxidant/ Mal allergen n=1 Tax=Granulicella tundricola (strain ATCC BAA-1859 / DSM 23138 / MP5ACTX9) TaxID=1198114 RepID=E8X247_GRATM|nr:TlpA disulfide reductase family protein [Granulicella tundricola]ADW70290.1 alkyl hydroperoxide reductase/ Thiol specific antioxidant/ Mal allergen [Granulicella tundricola MP5ACTX9]
MHSPIQPAALALLAALCVPVTAEPIAHSLTFQDRTGHSHTFDELRGHPAVINFWATWCGPCKEEMPRLQKLSESYAPQNVAFIAISLDAPDTRSRIDSVIQKRNFHLPIWTGATDATLTELKLGVLVPATLILDSDGEIIGKIEGEASEKDIRSRLTWALNGHQGKQPNVIQKNDW